MITRARARARPASGADEPVSTTVHASAYQRLKHEIVTCRLLPNQKLRSEQMRRDYGISVSSLREAFSRLVTEGLLIEEAHKGVRVADIDVDGLRDLVRVRKIIEISALRASMEHGDDRWESEVLAAFHMYEAILKIEPQDRQNTDERRSRHHRFHRALVAACDSPQILRLRELLYTEAERYLNFCFRLVGQHFDCQTVIQEHHALMEAVIQRRISIACGLMDEHIEQAAARAMPYLLRHLERDGVC